MISAHSSITQPTFKHRSYERAKALSFTWRGPGRHVIVLVLAVGLRSGRSPLTDQALAFRIAGRLAWLKISSGSAWSNNNWH